ncbi:GAF domain-containing protein [Almyronema epifaneia]|uniref:GAF domain-containing protein n=1 Tax=Almyronema epifaneia S1 TaxID=2991925 RepID=A0ABW6II19_9CYAN
MSSLFAIPPVLYNTLQPYGEADEIFAEALPVLGQLLQCDRCFLYLRHPQKRLAKVAYCWCRTSAFPDLAESSWQPENPEQLEAQDPLFAAALAGGSDIFIADIETASSDLINLAYEHQFFPGQRSLAHIHLHRQGQLWGILEAAMFHHQRGWTEFDRSLLGFSREQMMPLAIAYVKKHCLG